MRWAIVGLVFVLGELAASARRAEGVNLLLPTGDADRGSASISIGGTAYAISAATGG